MPKDGAPSLPDPARLGSTLLRWGWLAGLALGIAIFVWEAGTVGRVLLWSSVGFATLGCVLVFFGARSNLAAMGISLTIGDARSRHRQHDDARTFAARTHRYAILAWLVGAAVLAAGLILRSLE